MEKWMSYMYISDIVHQVFPQFVMAMAFIHAESKASNCQNSVDGREIIQLD